MFTLQVFYKKDRIYAEYRASRNSQGAHLTTIYPGGSFMGYSFDELADMGSGEHHVEARNPYDFQHTGQEPSYDSRWREQLARFEGVLFGYHVGAYTALEVLAVAREVDAARDDA